VTASFGFDYPTLDQLGWPGQQLSGIESKQQW